MGNQTGAGPPQCLKKGEARPDWPDELKRANMAWESRHSERFGPDVGLVGNYLRATISRRLVGEGWGGTGEA